MKTAYELAMERLGGGRTYTDQQKRELADIGKAAEAKKVEARMRAEQRLKEAGDDEKKIAAVKDDLVADIARIERKMEAEKDKVRNAADGETKR